MPCAAYLLDGIPYNVTAEPKTEADILQDKRDTLARVKEMRNSILLGTDWVELPGARARIGAARADALLAYRQAVWDAAASLVSTGGDPRTFTNWPVAP